MTITAHGFHQALQVPHLLEDIPESIFFSSLYSQILTSSYSKLFALKNVQQ